MFRGLDLPRPDRNLWRLRSCSRLALLGRPTLPRIMDCGTVGMVLSRSRWPPLSRDWELPGTSTRDGPVEDVVEEVGDGVLVGWRRRLALDVRSWMTELAWHSPRWQDWKRGKERMMLLNLYFAGRFLPNSLLLSLYFAGRFLPSRLLLSLYFAGRFLPNSLLLNLYFAGRFLPNSLLLLSLIHI